MSRNQGGVAERQDLTADRTSTSVLFVAGIGRWLATTGTRLFGKRGRHSRTLYRRLRHGISGFS